MHGAETNYAIQHAIEPWLDAIEKACGGRVKIDRYYAETLCKAADHSAAVTSGIADMSYVVTGYTAGLYPVNEVFSLPFLPTPSAEVHGAASYKALNAIPELQAEMENQNMKLLSYASCGPYIPQTTEKAGPIRTLEDWKGKKLRCLSGPPTEAAKNMGAIPVYVPMSEVYVAVERGVIDGGPFVWETVTGWGNGEIHKYFSEAACWYGVQFVPINLDTWNKLPRDIQDAIMSECGVKGSRFLGYEYFDTAKPMALELFKKLEAEGYPEHEVYDVPKEELDRWIEVGGKPTYEWWANKMAKAGNLSKARALEIIDEVFKLAKDTPTVLGKK